MLAVDPGSAKCGIAVVTRELAVLHRGVVPAEQLADQAGRLVAAHHPCAVVVGSGTGSSCVVQALRERGLDAPIELIDECFSSEQARRRYVHENRACGLQRLLPLCLRTPDRPYDDYVAVILAERWFAQGG